MSLLKLLPNMPFTERNYVRRVYMALVYSTHLKPEGLISQLSLSYRRSNDFCGFRAMVELLVENVGAAFMRSEIVFEPYQGPRQFVSCYTAFGRFLTIVVGDER